MKGEKMKRERFGALPIEKNIGKGKCHKCGRVGHVKTMMIDLDNRDREMCRHGNGCQK